MPVSVKSSESSVSENDVIISKENVENRSNSNVNPDNENSVNGHLVNVNLENENLDSDHPGNTNSDDFSIIDDFGKTEDETLNFDMIDKDNDLNLIELVVLDPDHPLMTRFQKALNEMLMKQLTRIELEEREINEDYRKRNTEYTESGNELFSVQQELAQFQSQLDQLQDDYDNAKTAREEIIVELDYTKSDFETVKAEFDREYSRMQNLRTEMDNLALRLYYLKRAKDDIKGDIAVMKRAAEKAVEDLFKSEKEKMHQDYILDTLVTEVDRLKEDINLYEAQLISQNDEKCAAQHTLREAEAEIGKITLERKKLVNKWNSSLLDVSRRNEALHELNSSLREKREHILVLENELNGYHRNISRDQDFNERMTLLFKRSEIDLTNIKRQIEEGTKKFDDIKDNYTLHIQILQNVEIKLSGINKDKHIETLKREDYLTNMSYLVKIRNEFEDKVTIMLQKKLSMESAKSNTLSQLKTTNDQCRELESKVVLLENKLSKESLVSAELKTEVIQVHKYIDVMQKEIEEKNDSINKLEMEIKRSQSTIERKQDAIDRLNKQYDALLKNRGGSEIGPLECTINHLLKNISLKTEENSNLEQKWLRQQHDMVALMKTKETLTDSISRLRQQHFLLVQRRIRTIGYIDIEDSQKRELEKELFQTQNKMVKINKMIDREGKTKEVISHDLGISETDLIRELKEEEQNSVDLQSKIDDIERDKDQLLKELLETQWQIMMFEKRKHLIEETQDTLKSGIAMSEVKLMKSEIHRMEKRYKNMKSQQEYLIQDMEKVVLKRDVITSHSEALNKLTDKVTTRSAMEQKIDNIKRKTKEVKGSTHEIEGEIIDLKEDLEKAKIKLKEKNETLEELQKNMADKEFEYKNIKDERYLLFMDLQQKQFFYRYYQEVKLKKYVRLCKTKSALVNENTQCGERLHTLTVLVERLMDEFPQVQDSLKPIYTTLQKTSTDFTF